MNAVAQQAFVTPRWVTFSLDAGRYALPLECVLRIVRAAAITSLPLAPEVVAGAIDVGGRILPVFNLRHRLALPERPLGIGDQFVIARTSRREVVLVVDAVQGLIDAIMPPSADSAAIAPHLKHLRGVLSHPDGLVLIHDLESLLSPAEDELLQAALRAAEIDLAR
jgi:purine-binding chemotaxis protein CheW